MSLDIFLDLSVFCTDAVTVCVENDFAKIF